MFERLRDEHGFTGGYTIVQNYMRERERRGREMFVPPAHPPGHAQADFGEATVVIGGTEQRAHFFVMDLPQSDGCYVPAYVHEVVIGCGAEVIARHRRSYETADMVFDPMHFLPLLEQKVGALDEAAPLQGWDLPDAFATLQRLLQARMGKKGKREYVQVLRLLGTFEMDHVHGAIRYALDLSAIGYRPRFPCARSSAASTGPALFRGYAPARS